MKTISDLAENLSGLKSNQWQTESELWQEFLLNFNIEKKAKISNRNL